MTARRDLDELERRGVARRTHGGAVLPGLSSREDSLLQRLEACAEAKERLAEAALALIEPGEGPCRSRSPCTRSARASSPS